MQETIQETWNCLTQETAQGVKTKFSIQSQNLSGGEHCVFVAPDEILSDAEVIGIAVSLQICRSPVCCSRNWGGIRVISLVTGFCNGFSENSSFRKMLCDTQFHFSKVLQVMTRLHGSSFLWYQTADPQSMMLNHGMSESSMFYLVRMHSFTEDEKFYNFHFTNFRS